MFNIFYNDNIFLMYKKHIPFCKQIHRHYFTYHVSQWFYWKGGHRSHRLAPNNTWYRCRSTSGDNPSWWRSTSGRGWCTTPWRKWWTRTHSPTPGRWRFRTASPWRCSSSFCRSWSRNSWPSTHSLCCGRPRAQPGRPQSSPEGLWHKSIIHSSIINHLLIEKFNLENIRL